MYYRFSNMQTYWKKKDFNGRHLQGNSRKIWIDMSLFHYRIRIHSFSPIQQISYQIKMQFYVGDELFLLRTLMYSTTHMHKNSHVQSKCFDVKTSELFVNKLWYSFLNFWSRHFSASFTLSISRVYHGMRHSNDVVWTLKRRCVSVLGRK